MIRTIVLTTISTILITIMRVITMITTMIITMITSMITARNPLFWLQAWLVPHNAEEEAKIGYCGFGSAPAVHSGFSVSWQGALRKAVCSIVTGAVSSEGHNATKMRLLVTGIS